MRNEHDVGSCGDSDCCCGCDEHFDDWLEGEGIGYDEHLAVVDACLGKIEEDGVTQEDKKRFKCKKGLTSC